MWRIWNKLFGWHYVITECGYAKDSCVARVVKLGSKFYCKANDKIHLIKKAKYNYDKVFLPLSMSQEEFDTMIKLNLGE